MRTRHSGKLVAALAAVLALLLAGQATASAAAAPRPVTWAKPVALAGAPSLTALSCVGPTFCIATPNFGGRTEVYSSGKWRRGPAFPQFARHDTSCVKATFCLAVGYSPDGDAATVFTGKKWSAPQSIDNSDVGVADVSCVSVTLCTAINDRGFAYTFNGKSWTRTGTVRSTGEYSDWSLDCTSRTYCLAAPDPYSPGAVVHPYAWNGKRWAALRASAKAFGAVECTSAAHCAIVVGRGVQVITGAKASKVVPSPLSTVNDLSCPKAGFCVAVGPAGKSARFDGAKWSKASVVTKTRSGKSVVGVGPVSCVSSKLTCTATDHAGEAIRGRG